MQLKLTKTLIVIIHTSLTSFCKAHEILMNGLIENRRKNQNQISRNY